METAKEFMHSLTEKLKGLINNGNINQANEVSANIMVGTIMSIMGLFTLIAFILNEFGVFTVNVMAMRLAAILSALIELPAVILNQKLRGDAPWLKWALNYDVAIMCAILYAILGHNVTIIMALPIIISIRYFDAKLTRAIVISTIIFFAIATVYTGFFGLINLNMVKQTEIVITADETLRQGVNAADAAGILNRATYTRSLFLNEFLPKFIEFSVLGIAAVLVAKRGRDMINLQKKITSKTERIETELNLATEIQTSMLPCIFPAFPEHTNLDLYAFNIPAKEVGGDFYDYFKIDDDHVALVMADVSGKGVGAALFMTISKIVIKTALMSEMSPAAALTKANAQICENNEAGLFVTVWAGIYQISTGKMVFTNAGHNPPIVRINGETKYLSDRHGLVLAGFDDFKYKESEITFASGDEIFLYTDGVTEATDPYDELYGDDRLLDYMKSIYELGLEDQIRSVKKDIDDFVKGADQFDDITMMGMKIK